VIRLKPQMPIQFIPPKGAQNFVGCDQGTNIAVISRSLEST
jgi:hypothetical protein